MDVPHPCASPVSPVVARDGAQPIGVESRPAGVDGTGFLARPSWYPWDRETRSVETCREEAPVGPGNDFSHIPIIDVSELVAGGTAREAVARRLGEACRES